jgi:Thioesterase domain
MIMAPSVWFSHGTLKSAAKIRLFCFPYAGRASVFCSWLKHLLDVADVCPVNLPGRGIRLHEKPFKQLAPLVRELASAIAPHLGVPFAFFGHSLCAPVGVRTDLRDADRTVFTPSVSWQPFLSSYTDDDVIGLDRPVSRATGLAGRPYGSLDTQFSTLTN